MKILVIISILLFTLSCESEDLNQTQTELEQDANVILLTLDGVRYEEFFNSDIFNRYWSKHAHQSTVLGHPNKQSKVRIANFSVLSLPAYKTIHSGKRSFCFTNNCGFPKEETLSEKLLRVHNWHQSKVAIISSWFNICYSAVRSLKNVLNSCGNKPLRLSDHDEININQTIDLPSWEGRKDKYTFQHAVKYIINHRPRFLHLALLDSDEWAHKNDWKNYIKSLKKYDLYIDQLFKLLENLGDYGNKTTVIITTDHGRGKGKKWTSHGKTWHARKIWMALKGPNIPHKGPIDHKYEVNHLHIRPIIELLLGVKDIYGKKRILKLFKDQLIQ